MGYSISTDNKKIIDFVDDNISGQAILNGVTNAILSYKFYSTTNPNLNLVLPSLTREGLTELRDALTTLIDESAPLDL